MSVLIAPESEEKGKDQIPNCAQPLEAPPASPGKQHSQNTLHCSSVVFALLQLGKLRHKELTKADSASHQQR